jgi:hypothetical protein
MLPGQATAETSSSTSTIEERKRFWRSEGEKTLSSSGFVSPRPQSVFNRPRRRPRPRTHFCHWLQKRGCGRT